MEDLEIRTYDVLHGGSLLLVYLGILLLSKLMYDALTPYRMNEELTTRDNVALSTNLFGYLAAVTIIFIGAFMGPSRGIWEDVESTGGYSLLGIGLLNLSRFINDRLILYRFSNVKEIIKDRNAGTGAVQAGSYLASGMIIAGAVHGEGGGILTMLAFFLLGQAVLIFSAWLYNAVIPYDIHHEIEEDNVAAGVAFGGMLAAVGIILMKGASGAFYSWPYNLTVFALDAALVIILIPMIRYFFDKVMIPGSPLNHEIENDRNLGAALLETVTSIGFAAVLFFTMG